MPTVLNIDGFRFFFYSSDWKEPIHIHVEKDNNTAKIWLNPKRLQRSHGFSRKEINRILNIIEENYEIIERCWNEFFKN